MNSTNKKSPGARGVSQPFKQREAQGPQFKPVVAQLKTGVSAQSIKQPVAPPVYRPQAAPKVLQTKKSSVPKPDAGGAPRTPVAPAVYRPEARKIVQPKASSQLLKPLTAPPVRSSIPRRFLSVIQRAEASKPKGKALPPPTPEELAEAEHEFFNLGAGQFNLEARDDDPNSVINFATSKISGVLYSWLQSIDTASRTFKKYRSRKTRDTATTKRWVLDLPIDLSYVYDGGGRAHEVVLDIHFSGAKPTGVGSCWVKGVGGRNSAVRSQECPALNRLYDVWLAGYTGKKW